MLTRVRPPSGTIVSLAAGLIAFAAAQADAEPSIHYADAPAVLPAPISYGVGYGAAARTATCADQLPYVSYRRTYTLPGNVGERVVYTTQAVRYTEPVVYTRAYTAPRRVLHVTTGTYGYPHGLHRHHRHTRWYNRPWHGLFRRGHRYIRHRHHYSPRGWGISAGYGYRHHGHRGGGFSFYLNR